MQRLPVTGDLVRYQGRHGLQSVCAAVVTADVTTVDEDAVRIGGVPRLDSEFHVHLWVFSPSNSRGGFAVFNVPHGVGPGAWHHKEEGG